jgi:hypothetical protein
MPKEEPQAAEFILSPPAAVSPKAMLAVMASTVFISNTERHRDPDTGITLWQDVRGSGFVASTRDGRRLVVTAAHAASQACKEQKIITSGVEGDVRVLRVAKESPVSNGTLKNPDGGGDQAVIIPQMKDQLATALPPAEDLEVGDAIYTVGYGMHYGADGFGTGDPHEGDRPTLIPGVVARIQSNEGIALVLTGFDSKHPDSERYAKQGDSGGPAVVYEDGEYRYVGVASRADLSPPYTPTEVAAVWDIRARLDIDPNGKYSITLVDLVSEADVNNMAAAAVPCR